MKTLMMPLQSLPSTTPEARVKRHVRLLVKGLEYVAAITLALVVGLATTFVLASGLAVALAVIVCLPIACVAALVFMVVIPEGNLLLLLLLSQVWLLYAPRETAPHPQPNGGLTIKPQVHADSQMQHPLAA